MRRHPRAAAKKPKKNNAKAHSHGGQKDKNAPAKSFWKKILLYEGTVGNTFLLIVIAMLVLIMVCQSALIVCLVKKRVRTAIGIRRERELERILASKDSKRKTSAEMVNKKGSGSGSKDLAKPSAEAVPKEMKEGKGGKPSAEVAKSKENAKPSAEIVKSKKEAQPSAETAGNMKPSGEVITNPK
ncbi:hypothetical protein OESDEN_10919 [Oesophagostomum dentatum]|uniref:Uncharacterized protein n=1 Tax=Oesophagostomum dentatum TaxID=61180 RepID=A0A0B1SZD0_OESDE|nr:hypothetical protein OESDEN_10919 [Oesophagostomum dentatum]